MSFLGHNVFAVLFVLMPFANAHASSEIAKVRASLNLKQSLQFALQRSPSYLKAQNEMTAAQLNAKNAFASFLPSIDLSSSHGVRGLDPDTAGVTTETPLVSGVTLAFTETFYDNGESSKKNQIAEFKLELTQLMLQQKKAQLIRDVTLAYYRHNIAAQNLHFTIKNHSQLERLAKLLQNQFHQGLKTKKDYLGFKTRAQRARLDVLRAEQDLVRAKAELLTQIGMEPNSQIQFDESVRPTLPPQNLTADIQVQDLYAYESRILINKISELEVDLVRRKYGPELDLVAAASYGSSDYVDTGRSWSSNEATEWSVLLNLEFNILDWGIRSRNIQLAQLSQNSGEQSARDSLLQEQKDLAEFKQELVNSQERYQLSKELQKMEEDSFQILERDYRSGQTTYLELITGLANLLDAQSRGQEADYEQANLYLRWKYYKRILSE